MLSGYKFSKHSNDGEKGRLTGCKVRFKVLSQRVTGSEAAGGNARRIGLGTDCA